MSKAAGGQRGHRPWGAVVALAVACAVTLVGVLRGMDPDVILLRAFSAAVACGVVISLAASIVRWLSHVP